MQKRDSAAPQALVLIFAKVDNAIKNNPTSIGMYNVIVRTRADSFPDFSDERYSCTDICGSHIITTDYPPRTMRQDEHTYSFAGYTVKLQNKASDMTIK